MTGNRINILILVTTFMTVASFLSAPVFADSVVPFVGCAADGQTGPAEAPVGTGKLVQIDEEIARKLAYYKATFGPGILAPRGWHCFNVYGSSASLTFVAPEAIPENQMLMDDWKGFKGSAVQISEVYGGSSGRFNVARVMARVFPKYKAFVQRVVDEGLEPADSFPSGPFPEDHLLYKNDRIVEYTTPANTKGLGTMSRLKGNDRPIVGAAMLVHDDPDMRNVSIRLPPELANLSPYIIQQAEIEK